MQYEKRMLIPTLSSNNGNSDFIIEPSSVDSSTHDAWKAFNGTNTSADDCWVSLSTDKNPYLIIKMKDYHYICGYTITSRLLGDIGAGEWKVSISDNLITWKEQFTLSTPTSGNTDKDSYMPKFKTKNIKIESLNAASFKCIAKLNFYELKEFCALKQDDKYYSFNEAQYDTKTGTFNEITLDQINSTVLTETCLAELEYLTREITIGEETFRPLDKFKGKFSIVSIKNIPITINGIKSNKELVVANNDFGMKFANNIDKFVSNSTVADGTELKVVFSTDSGSTWKTTDDNGVSWTTLGSLLVDNVISDGINILDLENINFNTIYPDDEYDRKLRLAYAFKINNATEDTRTTNLQIQYDAKGRYDIVTTDISLMQDCILVTPKEDMDIMKINVGSGGNLVVQEITNNIMSTYPTDEEITSMIEEVMNNG